MNQSKTQAAETLARAVRNYKDSVTTQRAETNWHDVCEALAAYEAIGPDEQCEWQAAIARDFARWFENEGVGSCFNECLAIVQQHAPTEPKASPDWMIKFNEIIAEHAPAREVSARELIERVLKIRGQPGAYQTLDSISLRQAWAELEAERAMVSAPKGEPMP